MSVAMFVVDKMRKRIGCVIQNFLHTSSFRSHHYVQGQSPRPGSREYFYYIDHQGMLFQDDALIKNFTSCFKDVKFLTFFFERLRINDTGRYEEAFPYVSPCGRESNFVRCEDLPVVFTRILKNPEGATVLPYNYCGPKAAVPFQPSKLFMASNGRVYHPGPDRLHGVGLVKSQLAIELSQSFTFDQNGLPSHFAVENGDSNLHYCKLDHSLKEILQGLGRPE